MVVRTIRTRRIRAMVQRRQTQAVRKILCTIQVHWLRSIRPIRVANLWKCIYEAIRNGVRQNKALRWCGVMFACMRTMMCVNTVVPAN